MYLPNYNHICVLINNYKILYKQKLNRIIGNKKLYNCSLQVIISKELFVISLSRKQNFQSSNAFKLFIIILVMVII